MKSWRCAAVMVALAVSSSAASAMTFNFINQGGATAQMMAGFAEAGALWSARLSDPITLNIQVGAGSLAPGVIAHTESYYDPYAYTDVRAAMMADRTSADDISASSFLQPAPAFSMLINRTANNPAGNVSVTPYFDTGTGGPGQAGPENNNTVRMTVANARALGLIAGQSPLNDAIITFATAVTYDFNRANGISAGQVDFVGVAAHELGHMLGFVSGVDILAGNAAAPGMNDNQLKFVTPLDLFRFSSRSITHGGAPGVNDWTADDAVKYFSVDGGTTPVAEFSTGATYEESHWKIGQNLGIMNPTALPGQLLAISTNDLRAMDVIGYNLTPVPEPSTGLLLGLAALVGIGLMPRHKRPPSTQPQRLIRV